MFVLIKDTISLDGTLTLDIVRGLDGVFGGSTRQDNLQDDVSIGISSLKGIDQFWSCNCERNVVESIKKV